METTTITIGGKTEQVNILCSEESDEHNDFVARVWADPQGLGTQNAQLYDVQYVRPSYRYYDTATRRIYIFTWRFHTECGKDRCLSAKHEMTLFKLVDAMETQKDDYY